MDPVRGRRGQPRRVVRPDRHDGLHRRDGDARRHRRRPVQGTPGPIFLYVDTILASGSTGSLAPEFGAGCEITNEFILGQTIVFRVYGNDAALGGVALTPANVSSATMTIGGVSTPLTLTYGNHGGVAFWTTPLATGTKTGQYSTLGILSYTVSFKTIAVAAVTKQVTAYKWVYKTVKGVRKHVKVSYKKTVTVTPAVAGATGTFISNFNSASVGNAQRAAGGLRADRSTPRARAEREVGSPARVPGHQTRNQGQMSEPKVTDRGARPPRPREGMT